MFSKIFSFSSRKTDKNSLNKDENTNELSTENGFLPDLDASHIRVLIFKDSDRKGKKLIYDTKLSSNSESSSSPNDQENKSSSCKKETKNITSGSFKRNSSQSRRARLSSDSTMLGEMIFGSVAMTYKGSTVKVHIIRSPHQLLLTKVFSLKNCLSGLSTCSGSNESLQCSEADSLLGSNRLDSSSLSSQNNSPKESQINGVSSPITVPGICIDPEEDSGFTASLDSLCLNSCSGSMTSLSNLASSPCGNFQRRLHRSQVKSIENSSKKIEQDVDEPSSPIMRRQRTKIGIGVLFPLEGDEEKNSALQRFFFAHFPLFDSHMHQLRCTIEKAIWSRSSFTDKVVEAIGKFTADICNLLKTPKLKEPVWLHMMSYRDDRQMLCEDFMDQLAGAVRLNNDRENGFFLSCLLSAVLSHHLSWVSTVMPAGSAPNRAFLDKHSSQTLDLLAQSHPYNPLWAQLSDLYGAIGFPLKLAKTVITGKNSKVIGQLLNLLSYFIRCTNVFEYNLLRDENFTKSSSQSKDDICCLCTEDQEDIEISTHKHYICQPCTESSGLSICEDCSRLLPQQLYDSLEENPRKVDDVPSCDKCGLFKLSHNSNGFIHKTLNGTYNYLSKLNLDHFLPDETFIERSETFRCYCCEPTDLNHDGMQSKASFQCYCEGDVSCSHCENKMNIFNHNSKTYLNGETHNSRNIFMELLYSGQLCHKLECTCTLVGHRESVDSGIGRSSVCCFGDDDESDLEDSIEHGPEELSLPGVVHCPSNEVDINSADKWRRSNNFGHTLFSGVGETYHPDFVLQGVTCSKDKILSRMSSDLSLAVQHSVIDDVVSGAVCIVADTDNWTCELLSAKNDKDEREKSPRRPSVSVQRIEASNLVLSMLSSVIGLWEVQMSAEFCLMHLEDKLKELYLKSKVVAEWLCNSNKNISRSELAKTLGIDDSDVTLLVAVASSHSPQDLST